MCSPCEATIQRSGSSHADAAIAWNLAADIGDAEAAFPVLHQIAPDRRELRVDDGHRHDLGFAGAPIRLLDTGDEDPHAFVHLRARQPDAVILAHRLDHVVDQLLEGGRTHGRRIDLVRHFAKHGMAHARDLQDRHDVPGPRLRDLRRS